MKIKLSNITFAIGLVIVCIPVALRGISYFNQSKVIYNYKSELNNMSEGDMQNITNAANDYNVNLADTNPVVSIDEIDESSHNVVSEYDFLKTGKVIGNIKIDKISVNLPIYDGITQNNLEKGIVHLDGTSYPTGKISTHSLLAGHTGLSNTVLLDNIDLLEYGDTFKVEYLGEERIYEVCDINIVLPSDTECLKIREGETLVTLVTCTPKGINSHRLLVTGRLTTEEKKLSLWEWIKAFVKTNWLYLLLSIIIFEIVIYYVVKLKNKLRKNTKKENETNDKKEEIKEEIK